MRLFSIFAFGALFLASNANADIIISQYYEGAGFDKYIELFNTGTSSVDLTAGTFKLSVFNNAANREGWKISSLPNSTLNLSGSIAAGGVFLIRHNSAVNPSYAVTASNQAWGSLAFSGDDSVVLWSGTTYSYGSVVDAFGVTSSSFGELSYVRNANIATGTNLDFSASDWTLFSLADVASAQPTETARLGFHEFNAVPEPTAAGLLALTGIAGMALRRRRS